jgi:hypothetical protein
MISCFGPKMSGLTVASAAAHLILKGGSVLVAITLGLAIHASMATAAVAPAIDSGVAGTIVASATALIAITLVAATTLKAAALRVVVVLLVALLEALVLIALVVLLLIALVLLLTMIAVVRWWTLVVLALCDLVDSIGLHFHSMVGYSLGWQLVPVADS